VVKCVILWSLLSCSSFILTRKKPLCHYVFAFSFNKLTVLVKIFSFSQHIWNDLTYWQYDLRVRQGCIKPGCQDTGANKFCTVVPNISGPSVQNLLHVTILAPRTLRWHLDFWKICVLLDCGFAGFWNVTQHNIVGRNLHFRDMVQPPASGQIHRMCMK